MSTEATQRSSWELAVMCLLALTLLFAPNAFMGVTSWSMTSLFMGLGAAFMTLFVCYGFTEQMRAYPWFWNTILCSDARVFAVCEVFVLVGYAMSVLLDLSEVAILTAVGVIANFFVVVFFFMARHD